MAGHVFVVHGDLTHLACDDWLIPTDRALTLTDAWLRVLAEDAVRRGEDGIPRLASHAPAEFCDGSSRVVPVPDEVRGDHADPSPLTHGRPWLLDVGTDGNVDPGWLVDGVRDWLDAVGRSSHGSLDRARPLIALPLVGTGAGGASGRRDEVLAELLPALRKHAEQTDVDIALVLNDVRDHAAAQDVRRRIGDETWEFDDDVVAVAEALAARAAAGTLSLFMGAGVSRTAGLPLWPELIDELLDTAGVGPDERSAVERLGVQDQAEYVARRLPGGEEELQEWVQERFAARPHSLAHALLAALPAREAVTTNWDPLFEQAVTDTGQRLAVLPYDEPDGTDRWLLKLHGDAQRGDGIVVRREDYLRFGADQAALAGMVQSLLFTRHMLFVGFSLVDDNFIRIANDVTRIVDRYAQRRRRDDTRPARQLGTTVGLHHDPAKRTLWPHLDHVVVADGSMDTGDRARRLELFLDLLSARVERGQAYLLDPRYQGLLGPADLRLAEHLRGIAEDTGSLQDSKSWDLFRMLLHSLGHPQG
jgi:hypothetical protein